MNIRYKGELIVLASIILVLSSYIFKYKSFESSQELLHQKQQEIVQLQDVISLQKIWSPNKISQKLDTLKHIIPSQQIIWNKRGKKLTVKFKQIDSNQLNKILNKILNIAIQIEYINIKKEQNKYTMELKCKW